MSIEVQSIVVTGGARGLGRAMVLGLLDAGDTVTAVGRDAAALNELAAAAASRGGRLHTLALDLAEEDSAERLLETVTRRAGRLDSLINCAAVGQETIRPDFISRPLNFWEVDPADWRRLFSVNVEALFRLCRLVVPPMLSRGRGRIVNVTTSLETMIRRGMAPYGPSKAAVEALSAVMAKDLEGSGVTVNVLVPGGPARTRMMQGLPPDKLIAPEVMVAPVRWLLSPAADEISGRRYRGSAWNPALPAEEAARRAGAPLAWPGIAGGAADTHGVNPPAQPE